MLIKRSGIDKQVRDEKERNRQIRKNIDQLTGVSRAKGAQRGDYKFCKENDKLLNDYRNFPKDREKINRNLEQLRREGQCVR